MFPHGRVCVGRKALTVLSTETDLKRGCRPFVRRHFHAVWEKHSQQLVSLTQSHTLEVNHRESCNVVYLTHFLWPALPLTFTSVTTIYRLLRGAGKRCRCQTAELQAPPTHL